MRKESYKMKNISTEPPKTFWKYYDLFRRKQITLEQFSQLSKITIDELHFYLFSSFPEKNR